MLHWLMLIDLYDDDTIQVSILFKCSLLIELSTYDWLSYLRCGLYVECVGHVITLTHSVVISDYTFIKNKMYVYKNKNVHI
jgi:uncharacterized membrane protein